MIGYKVQSVPYWSGNQRERIISSNGKNTLNAHIGLLKGWRKTSLLASHFMAHFVMLQRQRKGQDSHLKLWWSTSVVPQPAYLAALSRGLVRQGPKPWHTGGKVL